MCVCVCVYLPKSLVHTAISTSSSEQGLHVTENIKTSSIKYFNIKNNRCSHFLSSLAFVSSCESFHTLFPVSSLLLCVGGCSRDQRETLRSMWMRTAGEGGDVIAELPLDPVTYKNSYKTSRHSQTDRQAFFCLIRRVVQPSSPPTVSVLY